MRKCQGAVTVFLIIVLFATTLMGGLFIDASRILLAKRVVRNAADSAARSALAGYNEHLAAEYGLFAVDGDQAAADFKRYFKNNIELSQNDGFDILSLDVKDDNIKVTVASPLTDNGVLLDQMSEYAKYRSLVDLSLGVLDKFKGVFGEGKANQVTNSASTAQTLMDGVKSKAEDLSDNVRTIVSTGMVESAQSAKCDVSGQLTDESSGHYKSGTFTDKELGFDKMDDQIQKAKNKRAELQNELDTYVEKQQAELKKVDGVKFDKATSVDDNGNAITVDANSVYINSDAVADVESVPDQIKQELTELDSQISAAESNLDSTKAQIRAKATQVQELNGKIATAQAAMNTANAQRDALQIELASLKANPYRDYEYELNAYATDAIKELQTEYQAEYDVLQSLQEAGSPTESELTEQKDKVEAAGKELQKAVNELNGTLAEDAKIKTSYAEKEAAYKVASDAAEQKKKQYEAAQKARDEAVKELEKLYDNCGISKTEAGKIETPSAITESDQAKLQSAIGAVGGFVSQTIKAFQKIDAEIHKTDVVGVDYAFDFAKNFGFEGLAKDVWKTIKDIGEDCSGIVQLFTNYEDMDDAFFFTSYVFSTHTYFTSQTTRSNRHFEVGEIEYILQYNASDNQSQAACVTASLLDVAKLRLLINFITYMTQSLDPDIISRILVSLGKAFAQTLDDMLDMIFVKTGDDSAEGCALCPAFNKIRLSYSDHLRLKMMLRAIDPENRAKMFQRMLTMMQDTSDSQGSEGWFDTEKLHTRLNADVTVDVDLVMLTLPMFENVLPKDNKILQDGKFLVHETVSMGY